MKEINDRLSKNGGRKFLVGNSMSLGDIAVGATIMKFAFNPANKFSAKFKAAL